MSGYQPWIGTAGTPVEPSDYHRMNDEEAKMFFKEFVSRIPERVSMLEAFVRETPEFADWSADGSEASFRRLGPWVKQRIRIHPTTQKDPSTLRILNSDLPKKVVETIRREFPRLPWRFEDPVLAASVGADIGTYTAQRLCIANPTLKWKRDRDRRHMYHNHPVLTGKILCYYPTASGSVGYDLINGSYKENRWWEGFVLALGRSLP